MVVQYPDRAAVPGKAAESTVVGGIVVTSTPPEPTIVKGRYEPADANNEQQLVDGIRLKIKGIFYMPLSEPDIDQHIDLTVTNRLGTVILKSTVLFFSRGQLNSRVFL